MKPDPLNLNQRIGARVHELRTSQRTSLESLASKSGVSRSMISLIERGESSPTAVVLEKIAAGLGVVLASLFDLKASDAAVPPSPVAKRAAQSVWKDPASGYLRRNLSPPGMALPLQLVEVQFPAGKRVAFERALRDIPVHQQVWVLEGTIVIRLDDAEYRLVEGDCLAMQMGRHTLFHNPTRKTARYVVASTTDVPLR